MALSEIWRVYLTNNAIDLNIKTWFYTASPPISPQQITNKTVQFGNLNLNCVPQVAVGSKNLIKKLTDLKVIQSKPVKIL